MMPATASFRGDLESKLPLDLIHCILEYSGKHTLCSTSLVCKSWLQISQPSLFEGVNIGDFERLLERYTQTREILFRDSYPNAESIKHFSFDFERSFFVMETEKMSANMLSLVDQLKGKVPAAIKLSIFYQHADHFFSSLQKYVQLDQPFSPQLIPSICTTFCNITKLEIQLVKETIQNVLRFICSFPRLEVADIDCGEIVSLQSSSSNVIECTLSETLRNFSWRASTFNGSFSLETPVNNLEWLSYHPPRPHIFHLSLHVVFVLALNSFSSLCFTTLKSLYLSAHVKSYQLSYSAISFPCDLSALKSLERLIVDMPFDGFSIYATSADSSFFARNRNPLSLGAVTTLPNVLKTITTSHFRRLTLVAHFASDFFLLPNSDAEPEERAVSWKMLDEFLCSLDDQFPNLVIEIIITRPHDPYSEDTEIYTWKRDVERAARHRFRRCDADGKLLVTFSMTGVNDRYYCTG